MDFRSHLTTYIDSCIERIQRLRATDSVSADDRRALEESLRSARIVAGVLQSMHLWQAPALATTSDDPEFAGVQHGGKSAEYFNFAYMRQYAPIIHAYERDFCEEYGSSGQSCLLTGSGISAVSLALEALLRLHVHDRVELYRIGDPYGESEDLLKVLEATRRNVHQYFLESSTDAREKLKEPPSDDRTRIVYADAIENSPSMQVFRTDDLAEIPAREGKDYLVLDRTVVGHLWRERIERLQATWSVIEVESLTKYHQLGADIVTAGAVLFPSRFLARFQDPVLKKESGLEGIWRLRANHGGSPSTATVALLPRPKHERQRDRLTVHSRNARIIAARLAEARLAGWKVVHPTLPDHPDHDTGASCGLLFLRSEGDLSGLIDAILERAKDRGLLVSKRGSFGFNETTLDAWKSHIRIAAGTEEEGVAECVAGIFLDVLGKH